MIINLASYYVPDSIVSNKLFFRKCGIQDNEILTKCGISTRRWTSSEENTNTMAIEAVKSSKEKLPFKIEEIDLIIGATYTPFDTVSTVSHVVQKTFKISKAKCFTIDSACSSFVNAIEIVDCYFAKGKATKALIVTSENNSLYSDPSNKKSGFLWGDGAAAVVITMENLTKDDLLVLDVNTTGLGNIGRSIEAVNLIPTNGGLEMNIGNDVFQQACKYMLKETKDILSQNNLTTEDLDYLIPHQANSRIIDYVRNELKTPSISVLTNIHQYGNTGSASTAIVLAQNWECFNKDDLIAISVFGGGYSSGAVLLKKI
ncbi:MAG TPA: ketoacyl-ACP synthase III [Bacteroidales bacterium]|nr:ketoacyl-ACP synthase III [Bacteroidales bacterium]